MSAVRGHGAMDDREPIIPFEPFDQVVRRELARREWDAERMLQLMEERFGYRADSFWRIYNQSSKRGWIDLHRADRYLTVLGLHLFDVPGIDWNTEVEFREVYNKGGGGVAHAPEVVERGMDLLRSGMTCPAVAREMGISDGTVRGWKARLRAERAEAVAT